ncbi:MULTISPECIES: UV DNA damage repair endonuclease UvsE [Bacillaceae]|uniref:UV DNA damage repair endonuclease UvsE n=1 Tax=Evansella alkalicola TaxID=745819 RepID=A0ABS6JUS4_9BACI|nr:MULTISPECIES: UV DNA damage repair endonuclease UvsE [Bacillaceae]MBU9721454.1 UV DNA damage repair endonuclease UvsE [Bacillus alkalicola]
MRLGYACINTTMPTKFRTCRLATYENKGSDIIKELTLNNLINVYEALKWNVKHDILFYRMSTELVPLGSHYKMDWEWWLDNDILLLTDKIKAYKEKHDIRLSMHPGQFTVLSTPREEVLERSFLDLEYHDRLLNLVGGTDMIIHGGGQYGDMDQAKKRYVKNYKLLSTSIKEKLRLENDDKTYALHDVLDIHQECGVPICFDIHHHLCHNNGQALEPMLERVFASWPAPLIPKMHISSGKTHERDRSHHDFVFKQDFNRLLKILDGKNVDVMVEAKLKEQAVLRIQQEVFAEK